MASCNNSMLIIRSYMWLISAPIMRVQFLDLECLWFCHNGLALNPDKTDAILLGIAQRARSLPFITNINVAGTFVSLSENIKILGVVLHCKLSFNSHIANFSRSCFDHIHDSSTFVQLLQTTSPRPSRAHCLVAASTTPTPYYLARRQNNRTASSNPNHSGTSRHTTTRTNQHHEDFQGPTLSFCQVPHQLQGDNIHVQGSTVR